jgi:hypothetical protein
MTTTAGHSFYIGPIGFFYNQVNDTGSSEPLVLLAIYCHSPCEFKKYVIAMYSDKLQQQKKV